MANERVSPHAAGWHKLTSEVQRVFRRFLMKMHLAFVSLSLRAQNFLALLLAQPVSRMR